MLTNKDISFEMRQLLKDNGIAAARGINNDEDAKEAIRIVNKFRSDIRVSKKAIGDVQNDLRS